MIPRYARLLSKSYLFLIVLLTVFRALAGLIVAPSILQVSLSEIIYAFFIGWRFDNIVACFAIFPSFVVLTVNQFFVGSPTWQHRALLPLYVMLPIIVLLQVIDLMYYEHFGLRITAALLNWLDDIAFSLKMIADEPLWLIATLVVPLFMWGLTWPIRYWSTKNYWYPLLGRARLVWMAGAPLMLTLLIVGIWGRPHWHAPLRTGAGHFSENPALNQLALNPTYNFFTTWFQTSHYKVKALGFMSLEEAWSRIRIEHKITPLPGRHPLTRVVDHGALKDRNLVVVMMEGMSAHFTGLRRTPSWTPEIDRLMGEGLAFQNAFSAGIHTYNGVWSTVFSLPAPYTVHPLKHSSTYHFHTFAQQFAAKNYRTLFFTTHDDKFDNMIDFVALNGFQETYHQGSYPKEKILSIMGVSDHVMFEKARGLFREVDRSQRFMAALLTGSNHKPFVIPSEVKDRFTASDPEENIVRYADWSIGEFLRQALKEDWGKRTIFAFVADHGQSVGTKPLDQILSLNQVPMFLWAPQVIKPQTVLEPAMQIDLIPTALNYIGGDWLNSTLGRDLLHEPRQWAYFSRNDSTCVATATAIDCETLDGHHDVHALPSPAWPEAPASIEGSPWNVVHAELEATYNILMKRHYFP